VNLCDNRQVIGVSTPEFRRMGAFAEYVVVPERVVYALPDKMPFEHAALIEAVSIAVHAVSLTSIALGDTIVVIGAGMIGLLTLQAALLAGASRVYVCDVDESRLELARTWELRGRLIPTMPTRFTKFRNSLRDVERMPRWHVSAYRPR
jgi:L-iditol 2-dehydrogenase